MRIVRIDDCNCDRPRDTLIVFKKVSINSEINVLSIQEKK